VIASPLVSDRLIDLIIAFEVGSPELYERLYKSPYYPGGKNSGVTAGIGYDLGHRAPSIIIKDWHKHPHKVRLATASGITGPLAKSVAHSLADISIGFGYAREVFEQTMIIEHNRIARRVFRPANFDKASQGVRDALIDIVFNRGGSMAGQSRTEMRTIRDVCLPKQDHACIKAEIIKMCRINAGTDIGRGICRRRHADAALIK
jgi:GH24 family phage-related lysozyme (muramidase)